MKIEELRKLSDADLANKVSELKANLMTLRFQAKAGQLDNGRELHDVRKDIARALTVASERKIAKKEAK